MKAVICPVCNGVVWRSGDDCPLYFAIGDGFLSYSCPKCFEQIDVEFRAISRPPRDKMVRAAKVNKRVNG